MCVLRHSFHSPLLYSPSHMLSNIGVPWGLAPPLPFWACTSSQGEFIQSVVNGEDEHSPRHFELTLANMVVDIVGHGIE